MIDLIIDSQVRERFKRLDHYVCAEIPELQRKVVKELFLKDCIQFKTQESTAQAIPLTLGKIPSIDGTLSVKILEKTEPAPKTIGALNVFFEDQDLVVFYKPAGLITHGGPGIQSETVADRLMALYPDLLSEDIQVGEASRPGIVHRLDKGTSGVMVAAKSERAYTALTQMFAEHALVRRYVCVCQDYGAKKNAGRITSLIGHSQRNRAKRSSKVVRGKQAITDYKILERKEELCLVECQLHTGRTHQIRVHLSERAGLKILGDGVYGQKFWAGEILEWPILHAFCLEFVHPFSSERLVFKTAPIKESSLEIFQLFETTLY